MEIIIAQKAGFCEGVKRAIEIAQKAASEHPEGVHTLGELIHNRHEVRRLAGQGVSLAESLSDVPGGAVVFPSHGISPTLKAEAEARGLQVYDATCPKVKRAQRLAASLTDSGYQVVIIGDPHHAEVRGIVSHTGGRALVVSDRAGAEALPAAERIAVLSQTTHRAEDVHAITAVIRTKAPHVRVEQTMCDWTSDAQRYARELAGRVDVMVVIGGRNSANTRNLASVVRDTGTPAYHIEDAGELCPEWFRGVRRVGVTAGASTPEWITEEVVRRMQSFDGTPEEEKLTGGNTSEPAGEAAASNTAAGEPEEEHMTEDMIGLRPGQVVRGRVVAKTDDGLLVDVGYKTEGLVRPHDIYPAGVPTAGREVEVGDEIDAVVIRIDDKDEGRPLLSRRRAEEDKAWTRLEEAFQTGEVLTVPVSETTKGGLIVDAGVRAFMPASQVGLEFIKDLTPYVGTTVRARVIEVDRKARKAILSEKVVLEEERQRAREQVWSTIQEGDVRTGKVKRLTDFGAFVDIGGVDGLLHVSEMAWTRVRHPSEVLHEGETVNVKVLKVDRERQRISLGLKQLLPDPWTQAASKYREGEVVNGKVVRLTGFGAFVQLEEGLDGLVHISQLAPHRVAHPEEVVSVGQVVPVKILSINPEQKRISLSIKEAEQEQDRRQAQNFTTQQKSEGVTLGDMVGDVLDRLQTRAGEEEKPRSGEE